MQLFIPIILLCGLFQLQICFYLDKGTDVPNLDLQQNVLKILKRIHLEQKYDTIVIYGSNENCVFQEVLTYLDLPTVLFTQGSSRDDWNFNTDTLLLCCDSKAEQEQNTRNSFKLQQARRLIYLESELQPETLCKDYFKREQHNVAMVNEEGILHSCRLFQTPNHIQIDIYSAINSGSIYIQQFQNMQGAIIKSDADQMAPRSMLYRNAKTGKIEIHGHVANLVKTFVKRVNGTLHLPNNFVFDRVSDYGDMANKTIRGEVDIAIALIPILKWEFNIFDYLSNPYKITSYCLMVPVPKKLPYMQIYTLIVDIPVLGIILIIFLVLSVLLIYSQKLSWKRLSFVNVLLNDWCLRGLLGQSFPMPLNTTRHLKAICLILFFASLMMTTMYESYLNSFFTGPPTEEMLRSFEDVRNSRYKLGIERNELRFFLGIKSLIEADSRNAFVMNNYNEFIHMRNSFNVSFVYPVTELRWRTYVEQQKSTKEPIFYYSNDICFHRFVMFCIPIRKYLPYRHQLEQHILIMKEFGLVDFWIGRSFYDMVSLNMTTLRDYSIHQEVEEPIDLSDLTYIFGCYLIAHLIACICFAIECYWGRREPRVEAIRNR